MRKGTIFKLKVACLGNDIGTKGVVYENYELGYHLAGVSVIFENGNYDGFSWEDEIDRFLERISFCEPLSHYQFENVIKLEQDFKAGKFNVALKK